MGEGKQEVSWVPKSWWIIPLVQLQSQSYNCVGIRMYLNQVLHLYHRGCGLLASQHAPHPQPLLNLSVTGKESYCMNPCKRKMQNLEFERIYRVVLNFLFVCIQIE